MELRSTSTRGTDTSCRGLVNQVSSRRGRQADRRKVRILLVIEAAPPKGCSTLCFQAADFLR